MIRQVEAALTLNPDNAEFQNSVSRDLPIPSQVRAQTGYASTLDEADRAASRTSPSPRAIAITPPAT